MHGPMNVKKTQLLLRDTSGSYSGEYEFIVFSDLMPSSLIEISHLPPPPTVGKFSPNPETLPPPNGKL